MIFNFFVFTQLQFLFELPARLKKCLEMEAYSQAVRWVILKRIFPCSAMSFKWSNAGLTNLSQKQNSCCPVVKQLKKKKKKVIGTEMCSVYQ